MLAGVAAAATNDNDDDDVIFGIGVVAAAM